MFILSMNKAAGTPFRDQELLTQQQWDITTFLVNKAIRQKIVARQPHKHSHNFSESKAAFVGLSQVIKEDLSILP